MRSRAFTLIELLVVVLILGLLAAIVLPQFSNASAAARASVLMDDLRTLRSQIVIFKGQHLDVPPGFPNCDPTQNPTDDAFVTQMTRCTNANGAAGDRGTAGFDFGPYLSTMIQNPVNGKTTIQFIGENEAIPSEGDDSHGWIYQPATLILRADAAGSDEHGKAYIDY